MFKIFFTCLFLLSIGCIAPFAGFALPNDVLLYVQQDRTIRGVVVDQDGDPIPGATVKLKSMTALSTATDSEGAFVLSVPENDQGYVLTVGFIGYETQDVEVTDFSRPVRVQLQESLLRLGEAIVTGYTTESRRNITAAITTVDPEQIRALPKADVAEMLEGRSSGVQVMKDNSPGGGNSIRIRGFSTINNNEPLVVIDGVPVANGMNTLNPNDIESMQILKDAASSSIYGSRAANGVVVITTKSGGKADKVSIELNSYAGTQQAFNLPRMLDAQEYGDMLWQAYANDGIAPSHDIYGNNPNQAVIPAYLNAAQTIPSGNVDWVKEIFRPALVQSHNLAVSKGSERSSQLFSLGYFEQDGIIKETGFERFTARFNSRNNIADFLTIGNNFNASYTETVSASTNSSLGSIVYNAFQFPSIVPVRDINGAFGGNPINDMQNPLGQLTRAKDNKVKDVQLFGNVFAELAIKDFTFRSSVGLDYISTNQRSFSPLFNEILTLNVINSLSTQNSFNYQFTYTNTLNYRKSFGIHNLDILAGQEAVDYYYEGFSASRQNFMYEDPNYWFLDFGTANQLNAGNANGWALNSYFGKLNYNIGEKYLFSGTIRRDGTSRLANNKWGTFPAFSLGWRLDREDFFNLDPAFSSFLLRGGWGMTGNQQIPSYSTIRSYTSYNYNSNYDIGGNQNSVETGLIQSRVDNPDLKWETTTQLSLGVDLGFLNDKLKVTAEYYDKSTKDILVYSALPLTYGGSNDGIWINDGRMSNKGFEANVSYENNVNEFRYGLNLNFTAYKNELTELNSAQYLGIPSSSLHSVNFGQEVSRSAIGQPIGSFYGYVADGIFRTQQEVDAYEIQPNAQPGDIRFRDVNEDGVLDGDDRTFIGSPHPDMMLGFTLDFAYRGFDLNLFFNGVFGNDLYNLTKYKTQFFNQSAYNKHSEVLNAWSTSNPDATIPRLSLDDQNNNIRPSSYYVENGSYFKLNNLQLGYTFGNSIAKGLNIRVFGQATNLFTITNYSGMTPEIGLQSYSNSNRNLDIGIDRGLYPPARTFSIGVNVRY